MIGGIIKVPPENQRLYKVNDSNMEEKVMEDEKTLADYGLNANVAKAQSPSTVGLAIKKEDGTFEPLEIATLSSPPELPEVMKQSDPKSAGDVPN